MTVEARMRAAGAEFVSRPTPDLEPGVRARIATAGAPARPAVRRLAPAAAVLVVLVLGTLAVPSARTAVADFLGLPGVRIEAGSQLPPPEAGARLRLGERVTLRQARAAVAFAVRAPALLGTPDEIWLDRDAVPGGQVTLLWRASRELPAAGPHGVGALLTLLPGSLEPGLLAKFVYAPETRLTSVSVGGGQGWWVSGDEHALLYLDQGGKPLRDRSRLAGDTLLWQAGGVIHRLESGLTLERALELARSL